MTVLCLLLACGLATAVVSDAVPDAVPANGLLSVIPIEASGIPEFKTEGDWVDSETLHWDSGEPTNALGLRDGGIMRDAARFTPSTPCTLTSVVHHHWDPEISDCYIVIYGPGTDTTPGLAIDSASYPAAETGWLETNFVGGVVLPGGTDFWVSRWHNHAAGKHPASMDDGPMVRDRGGFLQSDVIGPGWLQIADIGFNCNWSIRAVVVAGAGNTHDVGATAVLSPGAQVLPGPVTPEARIYNFGSSPESSIPVYCVIDSAGTVVYTQRASYAGPLAPGATGTIVFTPDWNPGPAGNVYDVTMYTLLVGDEDNSNDTVVSRTMVMGWNIVWVTKTSAPSPGRYWSPGTGVVRDTIYYLGGREAANPTVANIAAYDIAADAWITSGIPTLNTGRRAGAGGQIGNKIYACGGRGASTLSSVEEFDVDTKIVTTKAPMPSAAWACAGDAVGGKLYIVGSENRNGTTYEYDPVGDAWTTKTPLSPGRGWHAAVGAGGKLYVTGGSSAFDLDLVDCWEFDPVANTWAQKADMPGHRKYHFMVSYDDTLLYVLGGAAGQTADALVYKYSIPGDVWSAETPMLTARGWEMGNVVGNSIFVAYGSDCSGPTYLVANEEGLIPTVGIEEYRPGLAGASLNLVSTNPVRDYARVSFTVVRHGRVSLGVYDVNGSLVRTLVDGMADAGERTVTWDRTDGNGRTVANGTYFYRLVVDGSAVSAKAVVLD